VRLPNCANAFIDIRKLIDYSLNAEHPRGQHKAHVFREALGLTSADAEALRDTLFEIVCNENAVEDEHDEYGQRYALDFTMTWKGKQALVRSTWIIRVGEDFPRLTSCYVL
jgi:hypothetical protein